MVNIRSASHDPKAFPKPESVRLDRPLDSYLQMGYGPHQCLGLPMTRVALTTMFKAVFKLEGLKPATVSIGHASGPSKVKKVLKEFWPGDLEQGIPKKWHYHAFMTEDWDIYFPFPTSKFSLWWQKPAVCATGLELTVNVCRFESDVERCRDFDSGR